MDRSRLRATIIELMLTNAAAVDVTPRQTKMVEARSIVTNGSTVCPSRERCDRYVSESHEGYIRRHCRDHDLGEFVDLYTARLNLFLHCFYYAHKYEIGNPSLSAEPFWEHHVFMSEWEFNPDDLEQGWDRDRRIHYLPDYAKMRPGRIFKRFKKVEKPRGTQKSSVGRAYVTWRLLRAYYLEDNPYFRVLTISATSRLGRSQWFKPLKTLWSVNKNLVELFGMWEFTCHRCGGRQNVPDKLVGGKDHCPQCEERLPRNLRMRRVGLVTKGSFGLDSIQMRWTVIAQDNFSGLASENFQFLGCDSEIAGQRFDLAMCDDLSTKINSRNEDLREAVKVVLAEVMKTLDQSSGQIILSNTRKHLDDLAGDIDKPDGPYYEQFHIFHRKATWISTTTGETKYYWAQDAQGKPRLNENFLRYELQNSSERDFYSEYQNEPQDPNKTPFRHEWFEALPDAAVPAPVLWGLGEDLTPEQEAQLRSMGVIVHSIIYCDAAGQEKQKTRNDDTAVVCVRIFQGTIYIVRIESFKGPDSYEKERIYQAAVYVKPRRIRYEMPVHSKGIEHGWINFANEKSHELSRAAGRPIAVYLPMDFQPIATLISKADRMHKTEPLWRAGRIKLLERAGAPNERAKFRDQHCSLGIMNRDDYPDATSGVLEDFGIPAVATLREAVKAMPEAQMNERGNVEIPMREVFQELLNRAKGQGRNWGVNGGSGR